MGLPAVFVRAAALGLALTVLSVAPSALADPAADAFDLKRRGDEALVSVRPADALGLYKQSYALKADPALLYNMGRAYQALDDLPSALDKLEQFEQTAPAETRARVPGLSKLIADVRKSVATIAVAADVSGATIRLDERSVGTTPLKSVVRVKAGPTTIVVEKEGYFPYQRALTLQGGSLSTFDVKLASKQTSAVVAVRSPVVGAFVSVDGKPEGTVPTEMYLSPGAHQLELTHNGYQTARSSLVVAAGERKTLDLALEAETPITKKWWFWTGVGVVVAGAVATVIVLTTERGPDTGTVAPGRISTGLRF